MHGVGEASTRYGVLRVADEVDDDDAMDDDEDVLVMAGLVVEVDDTREELELVDEVVKLVLLAAL